MRPEFGKLTGVVSRNFDIERIFVQSDVELIGPTAYLTVLNVVLIGPSRQVDKCSVWLSTESTRIVSGYFHKLRENIGSQAVKISDRKASICDF